MNIILVFVLTVIVICLFVAIYLLFFKQPVPSVVDPDVVIDDSVVSTYVFDGYAKLVAKTYAKLELVSLNSLNFTVTVDLFGDHIPIHCEDININIILNEITGVTDNKCVTDSLSKNNLELISILIKGSYVEIALKHKIVGMIVLKLEKVS